MKDANASLGDNFIADYISQQLLSFRLDTHIKGIVV